MTPWLLILPLAYLAIGWTWACVERETGIWHVLLVIGWLPVLVAGVLVVSFIWLWAILVNPLRRDEIGRVLRWLGPAGRWLR